MSLSKTKLDFPLGPMNPNLKILNFADENVKCDFCKSSEVNEVSLGPLISGEGFVVHYFCVLFSSSLKQEGETDIDGILGFLPADLKKEIRRGSHLKCTYCQTNGATIGCCHKRCKVSYHFPCGLRNKVNFQFSGVFESFCVNHSRKRIPPAGFSLDSSSCMICFAGFGKTDNDYFIVGCCCELAVFHKECVQKLAFTSGYCFKCPACECKDKFVLDMKLQGIYVPHTDAIWEKDPRAYSELLYQYKRCDAEVCECPKGRTYGAAKGNWLLARCRVCGSAGTHRQCGKLPTIDNWECQPCKDIGGQPPQPTENKVNGKRPGRPKASTVVPSTSTPSLPARAVASTSAAVTAGRNGVVRSSRRISENTSLAVTPKVTKNGSLAVKPKATKNGSLAVTPKATKNGLLAVKPKATKNISKSSTHIIIHPYCRDYFPYTPEQLDTFRKTKSRTIPDWHNKRLRVYLTNIFGSPVMEGQSDPAPEASTSTHNTTLMPPPPPPPPLTTDKRSSGEKRQRRKCSWQKGVVKPRKSKATSKTTPTRSTSNSNGTQAQGQSSAGNHGTELPQSSTKVLAGIQSAQQTLLRWAHDSPTTRQERKEPPSNASAANAVPNPTTSVAASIGTRHTSAAVSGSNAMGPPPSNQRNEMRNSAGKTGGAPIGLMVEPRRTNQVQTLEDNDSTPIVINTIMLDYSTRANEVDDDDGNMSTAETEICYGFSDSDTDSVVVIGARPAQIWQEPSSSVVSTGARPAQRRQEPIYESDTDSVVSVDPRPAQRWQEPSSRFSTNSVVSTGARPAQRRQEPIYESDTDTDSVVVISEGPEQRRQEPSSSSSAPEPMDIERTADFFVVEGNTREGQEALRRIQMALPDLFIERP